MNGLPPLKTAFNPNGLNLNRLQAIMKALDGIEQCNYYKYFPDCKPECQHDSPRFEDHVGFCRVLYTKSLEFWKAGALGFDERLFLAANRVGKTESASFEVTAHLTGRYPKWWNGHKFTRPIRAWGAGETMETTRNIIQVSLLGPYQDLSRKIWSGMIPPYLITNVTKKSGGVSDCADQISVRHASGGSSTFGFKSFDQGERGFQGTERDLIWLDEQVPPEVYSECKIRTLTTKGHILTTFTPLQGLTEFIQQFLDTAVMGLDTQEKAAEVFWPEKA